MCRLVNIILLIAGVSCSLNLIKNGDFEVYEGIPWNSFQLPYNKKIFWILAYAISSNISQWYNPTMGQIQLQKLTTENTTIGVDLSSSIPMTLCQNVSLITGSKYNLSFDMYTCLRIQNMLGKAYLNGNLLTQIYIPTNSTFVTKKYSFFADRNQNSLCFNETHTGAAPFPYSNYIGGVIDNFTLFLVEQKYLMFKFMLSQIQNSLFLEGNATFNQDLAHEIPDRYNLLINDRPISYEIKQSDAGALLIEIKQNYSFNLENIKLEEKLNYIKTSNSTFLEISLSHPTKKKYYHYLRQNEVMILTKSKHILVIINQFYSRISGLSQIFLFAYFVNMIIGIEFLSLFYVFTQITTIPDFTNKIYHQVLNIVFSTKSLIQYFQDWFKIPLEKLVIQFEDFTPEKIEEKRNEETWFGTYRLSSKVIKSNMNSIFVLGLSLVKLVLVKLTVRLLGICAPSFLKLKIGYFSQILTQFCFLIPIFLISLQANIIQAVKYFSERNYKAVCLLFIFISLMLIFLYIFLPSFTRIYERKREKKSRQLIQKFNKQSQKMSNDKQDKQDKKAKKDKKYTKNKKEGKMNKKQTQSKKSKNRILFNQQAYSMLIIFFIPFLSFISNTKIYLLINTLSVLFRFFGFMKFNERNQLVQRFIEFLIGFVWLVHHTIFVGLFFYQESDLNDTQIQLIICLGIAAILTVTLIIILQSLKFAIQTVIFLNSCNQFFFSTKAQEIQQQAPISQNNKSVILVEVSKNQPIRQQTKKKKRSKKVLTKIHLAVNQKQNIRQISTTKISKKENKLIKLTS